MRAARALGLIGAFACTLLVSGEREAHACGGCFHEGAGNQNPVIESSVVSDHRMVFAIGPQQTALWDQIRYTGDPTEFAWVLPVRPGTTIELSRDEWIASLDAITQPQIVQPRAKPIGSFGGYSGGGGDDHGGCTCASTTTVADTASYSGPSSHEAGAPPPPPPVQVIAQEVVGPYETVIVRSDKPKALETWLQDHGYAIPDSILPIIDAYTKQKLDFVAVRLRPGQGVRAMQPVRIVSPGADPTLPLRMVAAGIGAKVGLTLYVLSEGRYRPQNFPEARIDETKLVWDTSQNVSNYQQLSAAAMAGGGDRTWLTEFAGKPNTQEGITSSPAVSLYDAYYGSCMNLARYPETLPSNDAGDLDAGDSDANDAGDPDASLADDAGAPATPLDAGARPGVPASLCTYGLELCCDFDDLGVAVGSLHRDDVWLTRLRADLPAAALAEDLRLEAHPEQVTVSNIHNALLPSVTPMGAQIAPARSSRLGTGLVVLCSAFLVGRMVRRRRRSR